MKGMAHTYVAQTNRMNEFGSLLLAEERLPRVTQTLKAFQTPHGINKLKEDGDSLRAMKSWIHDPLCPFREGAKILLTFLRDLSLIDTADASVVNDIEEMELKNPQIARMMREELERQLNAKGASRQQSDSDAFYVILNHLQNNQPRLEAAPSTEETQALREQVSRVVGECEALKSNIITLQQQLSDAKNIATDSMTEVTTTKAALTTVTAEKASVEKELEERRAYKREELLAFKAEMDRRREASKQRKAEQAQAAADTPAQRAENRRRAREEDDTEQTRKSARTV
ncbi:hypothetical protein HK097_005883 [Rhizophlyctis rosea]|uniref:Uncharacterized protein n=1 Tax=Rhizophlyctis rosea TaxID=64517 RepID=A0AAD5X5Y5_9FUNG|nr:hypothetical protein HK097_005883 [Rhizophlyctis rosea]